MNDNIKILIVDDEPDILFGTSRILETAGYNVLQAESSEEALTLTATHTPDIILIDYVMPGINGIELCKMMKTDPKLDDSYILIISGKKIDPDDRIDGLNAGADGYITRPFIKKEFLIRLKTLTRIQQTLKKIKKSEKWLNTAIKNISDGVIATDAHQKITFMNPVAEEITGWNLNDAEGKPCKDIFRIRNDMTGGPMVDPVKKVIDEGVSIGLSNHTILFRKDGTTCFISDSAAPIKDINNKITGVALVFQDVTQIREKELAVKIARKDWEDIFEAIGHPTTLLDSNHNILRVNKAALKMLQKPHDEIKGKKCYEIYHNGTGVAHGCPMENMIKSGSIETQDMEMEALGRCFLVSCTPVFNNDGSIKHVIHIATDITKRKESEKEIKKALTEKNYMLNEIHHRVKNNLAIVNSLLDIHILKDTNENNIEVFKEIKNRVYSMSIVHEKLYDTNSFSEIPVKEIIENIINELLKAYNKKDDIDTFIGIDKIYLDIKNAIPCVLIINELMTNTIKHAFSPGKKGEVYIKLKTDDDGNKQLLFQDNGRGMPDNIDFDNPATMGLKILSVLTDQIDGKINVISEKGTSYLIEFN